MSASPDTSQSSLTTTTTAESFACPPSSPPRGNRKSPPPPKLALDDCKLAFATTATNTSNNAASKPSTAFVFTSSRTLRNLHNYSPSTDDASGQYSVPSSASSSGSVSPSSKPHTPTRPTLSHAQLARHSNGAVDARCIVSPNMRAAGFVPLSHSPVHHSSSLSGPPTPIHSPVPTPVDPPRFPPIVFFNPANVTTTSLWDYQRHLQYGLPTTTSKAPAASTQKDMKRQSARPSINPLPNIDLSTSSGALTSGTPSYSSLFSQAPSSRSSATSVYLSDLVSPDGDKSSKQGVYTHEAPAGEYPFPATPPRSRLHSHEGLAVPCGQKGVDSFTTSPCISSSTASGSMTPLAPSPALSVESLPHSSSGSKSLSPEPARSTSRPGRQTRTHSSSLSITELCQVSPRAWFIDNLMLPQSTAQSISSRDTNRNASSANLGAHSRGRRAPEAQHQESKSIAPVLPKNPDAVQAASELAGSAAQAQEVQARTGSPKMPSRAVAVEDETGRAKKREKHRGREKDRETDKEKERERRRKQKEKDNAKKAKRRSSSSPTASPPSSPASTTPSPGRGDKAKDRTRDSAKELSRVLKGKAPARPQFASIMFPPCHDQPGPAHTLGSPDPLLEYEREREDAGFARDAVLAHRERDRMDARFHGEKERRALRRSRVAAAPTAAYTSTYDRGRGRGLGRGERSGLRGRGASVSSLGAQSALSEGETAVQDELEDAAEQLIEPVVA